MDKPIISVIIPVYNAQDYIVRCLDSICRNTYKNLDIICVNDGSRDKSSELIKEYHQSVDQRVRLIDQVNRGVSAARNAGMDAAMGEYIAFIDSDDWIHPNYFEFLINAIEKADVAHCEMQRVNAMVSMERETLSEIHLLNADMSGIEKITDHCWGKLFRKSLLENIRFSEHIAFGEDKLFTTLALQKAKEVALISNRLYFYYNNSSSAVNTMEHDLFLPAVEFLNDAENNGHALSLKYAYTGFLSYRYISMFKPNAKDIRKKCNTGLKVCKRIAKGTLPIKQRMILGAFADVEPLYRLYRIVTDRTMIAWEKVQKEKYRTL